MIARAPMNADLAAIADGILLRLIIDLVPTATFTQIARASPGLDCERASHFLTMRPRR